MNRAKNNYNIIILFITLLLFSFQTLGLEPKNKKQSIFIEIIHEYMYVTMDEYKRPLSKENMKKFHYESALAHIEFLKNWFDVNKDKKTRKGDVNFHEAVMINKKGFKASDLPYDAWFFADIYDVLDDAERDKFWQDILNAISHPETNAEVNLFIKLWSKMRFETDSQSVDKKKPSQRWLNRMKKIPLVIEMVKTMEAVEDLFIYSHPELIQ